MTGAIALHYASVDAPEGLREAAEPFGSRFGTVFDSLTYFSSPLLDVLHTSDPPGTVPPNVQVASHHSPTVVEEIDVMTEVANLVNPSEADRSAYRDALLRIYGSLALSAAEEASSNQVLCVGPEREGRELAEMLGALPEGRSVTPSAKRIPYDDGLLIGLSGMRTDTAPVECLIIDGVVASGATMMALLQALPSSVERATLLTAHSTEAGVWAMHRYAQLLQVDFQIVVGHVSGVLNDRFYATDRHNPGRLLLGDVGDTISGLTRAIPERD